MLRFLYFLFALLSGLTSATVTVASKRKLQDQRGPNKISIILDAEPGSNVRRGQKIRIVAPHGALAETMFQRVKKLLSLPRNTDIFIYPKSAVGNRIDPDMNFADLDSDYVNKETGFVHLVYTDQDMSSESAAVTVDSSAQQIETAATETAAIESSATETAAPASAATETAAIDSVAPESAVVGSAATETAESTSFLGSIGNGLYYVAASPYYGASYLGSWIWGSAATTTPAPVAETITASETTGVTGPML